MASEAISVSVKLEDWRGEEIADAIRQAAIEAVAEVAEELRSAIEVAAPVETGRLKANWQVTYLDDTNAVVHDRTHGVKAAFWGMYSEFGTRERPPKPFVRPVIMSFTGHLDDVAAVKISEVIE